MRRNGNLSFAVFPTIGVMLTLFRIGLYVASLRAVVWKGMAGSSAGTIISAFSAPLATAGLAHGLTALLLFVLIELFIIARVKDKHLLIEEYLEDLIPPGKPNPPPDFWLTGEQQQCKYAEADFAGTLDFLAGLIATEAYLAVLLTSLALPLGLHVGLTEGMAPHHSEPLCRNRPDRPLFSHLRGARLDGSFHQGSRWQG